MGTAVIVLGIYMALAVLFYARLTATATDGLSPRVDKPPVWHRARRRAKEAVRRMRPARKR